jgi:peptidoglycan-associated lipoprotein
MRFNVLIVLALAVSLAGCAAGDSGAATGAGGANGGYGPGGANGGAGGAAGVGGTGGNAAPGSEEDLVQSVGDRIFFATAASTLSDEARATLDRQVAWLQRYPAVSIIVAGNCDERGTEEYNLALGQRRANADREYLVARGIDAGRIRTISYGKDRPTDPSSTEDAWGKNRNAISYIQ